VIDAAVAAPLTVNIAMDVKPANINFDFIMLTLMCNKKNKN
jgi:hypothetical protein